jgi:polysaccharide chain length determinant protein (PEP-CTERM system associated)
MEPQEFLEIFRQRKWLIIFSFLFIMFGTVVYSVITPDQYRSSTTILVIPQRVPEKFVSSTVTYSVEDRLTATSQQILSRTRLMAVIDELGFYKEERKTTPPEILAKNMRKNIKIKILRGRDAFRLSFENEDPNMAMLTVSKLASFFIDENLKVREQLATGTSEFLDSQVQEVKRQLEEQEEKVKRYKLTYMGELPQQMQANLSMLSRLQDQRRANADAIAKAEDRKVFLESQISGLQNQIRTKEGEAENPKERLLDEYFSKREQLEDLSAKYTQNYPTVVQLRREVQQLDEKIATIEEGGLASIDNNTNRTGLPLRLRKARRERGEIGRLRAQVRSLDLDLLAWKREQEEIQRASDAIQEKVARLPQREQEMIALTRDYNNLRKSYDDLMRKKLSATVSQNLEERQKGEQFQVLDPPVLPTVPFAPERMKILMMGFMAALAFGFGGAIGLEMMNPTLRGTKDFKYFFELPILASIPIIQDDRYARKNALRRAAVLGGIFSFMCAFIVFLLMFGERVKTILQF